MNYSALIQALAKALAADPADILRDLEASPFARHYGYSRAQPYIEPLMRLQPSALANDAYDLLIYGDIGDSWWSDSVTAKSVVEQLNALDASIDTINVRINSYGGSVSDGLAIYNALMRHPATIAVSIDGVAMSSASLIAMAGDTITMPATSLLMIHAPWGGVQGNAKEMRQYADVLDTFAASMADAYVAKSGKSRDDVLTLLTDGEDHYYTGEEAIAEGFADAVGDVGETDEPDDSAREFARALLSRMTARGAPSRYAGLAVAAALRPLPHTSTTTKPNPAAERRSGVQALTVTVVATAVKQAVQDALAELNPPPPAGVQSPPADAGTTTPEETPMSEEEKKAAAKAALAADKARRDAIASQFQPFMARAGLKDTLAKLQKECEDDHDCTVEAAGAKLLAALGKDVEPLGSRSADVSIVRDEHDTLRTGIAGALLHRCNPTAHKLEGPAAQFRGMTLMDVAREVVEAAGQRTRGMTRGDIAIKALQSTSDFPAILENVVTKTLRAAYAESPRTFVPFSRQATLPDFKEISRTQLSGAPNLLKVVEGAEYEYGEMTDGAEKYRVQKYGRILAFTWETIVNDDLSALSRLPAAFGASAAALESDIVYAILTGNPNMADGKALFSAGHGNLGTATALAEALNDQATLDPIAEAREKMTLQKGLEGRYITVRPRYLVVPPRLEKVALQVTGTNYQPAKQGDVNVFGPSLTPISEPRLQDASGTAYYVIAEPSLIDTIEYAYLDGYEGVFTETKQGFNVDGVEIKCRHVFGAKAIDYRGMFKNAGE